MPPHIRAEPQRSRAALAHSPSFSHIHSHYSPPQMSPHDDDLGLSLSLAPAFDNPHLPIAAPSLHLRLLPSPFLRGIDVNRAPVVDGDAEEDVGVSSPNSTVSCVSGKRGHREETTSENDRACSAGAAGGSDDEDAGDGSRKKLRLSKDQSAVLEESFKEHNTLNPKQKMALAKQLNLRPRQVEVWFQNRRARTKLKQTEVDCEFLKRCCENLTEENRRLQKEVQELRALKLSPQFYMHMTPPTTLTMCPSCERVSTAAAAAPPTSSAPVSAARPASQVPSSNSKARLNQFFQQQHSMALVPQNRPMAMGPNVANPVLPWAPMPLRAGAFVNVQTQRS